MTSKSPVGDIPVVTLIRTDTTLDHSQKAEKVCHEMAALAKISRVDTLRALQSDLRVRARARFEYTRFLSVCIKWRIAGWAKVLVSDKNDRRSSPFPKPSRKIEGERSSKTYTCFSIGRGESGWCSDWTSTPGAWRHAGAQFPLPGAFLHQRMQVAPGQKKSRMSREYVIHLPVWPNG